MFHQLALAEWRMKYIPRKSGSSRATRCISFFAFPPDPPCVLWPPASLPYHCFLVGCSRITLACAWHSTTYRLCGSPFGFSASLVPPAGGVGSPPASCTLCLLCYTWPPGASLATRTQCAAITCFRSSGPSPRLVVVRLSRASSTCL